LVGAGLQRLLFLARYILRSSVGGVLFGLLLVPSLLNFSHAKFMALVQTACAGSSYHQRSA
jgi:hypothetical protein